MPTYSEERRVRWVEGDVTPESETYYHQYSRPYRNYDSNSSRFRPLTSTHSYDSREVHIHQPTSRHSISPRTSPILPTETVRHHHHHSYSTSGFTEPRYSASSDTSSSSVDDGEYVKKSIKLIDQNRKLKHELEISNAVDSLPSDYALYRPRTLPGPVILPPAPAPVYVSTQAALVPVGYKIIAAPQPRFETTVQEVPPQMVGARPVRLTADGPTYHGHGHAYHAAGQTYYAASRPVLRPKKIWARAAEY